MKIQKLMNDKTKTSRYFNIFTFTNKIFRINLLRGLLRIIEGQILYIHIKRYKKHDF